jgi:5-methylcytosine-specific restriction endonuclease McrA
MSSRRQGGAKRASLKRRVFTRDDFTCQVCGQRSAYVPDDTFTGREKFPDLTLGHLVAERYGGRFAFDNLRAECPDCNLDRGQDSIVGWQAS